MLLRGLVFVTLGLSLFLSNCGSQSLENNADTAVLSSEPRDAASDATPPTTEPVAIAPELAKAGDDGSDLLVRIPKDALGADFLLTASVIPQTKAATSSGLAGTVVRFERFGQQLDMFGSSEGQTVTSELPSKPIMASFEIVREDDTFISVDFSKGMNVLSLEDWVGVGDSFEAREASRVNLDIKQSRVFSVNQQGANTVIRQSVLAGASVGFKRINMSVEIRYFLKKYIKGGYVSREWHKRYFRSMGFFLTPTMLEETTGREVTRALTFDASKPIVFHVSANTPAEYLEAVKEGVLYWNHSEALKDKIKVDIAPAGVTAPDANYNVVQWVPFDSAGVAYADLLADPLTGEALHAQVYITSVFAVKSREDLLEKIRLLEASMVAQEENKQHVSLSALPNLRICNWGGEHATKQVLSDLQKIAIDKNTSDERILEMSRAYVSFVVAHEIGHVLGLRHNFAGSTDSKLSNDKAEAWFNKYLKDGVKDPLEGAYTTSSTMDYAVHRDDMLGWEYHKQSKKVFPYDDLVMNWAVKGDEKIFEREYSFCTDEKRGSYLDCLIFDVGADLFETRDFYVADFYKVPEMIIESYIAARFPKNLSLAVPVKEHDLIGVQAKFNKIMARGTFALGNIFDSEFKTIRYEKTFTVLDEDSKEEQKIKDLELVNLALKKHASDDTELEKLFFGFLPDPSYSESESSEARLKRIETKGLFDAEILTKKLETLLTKPNYTSFTAQDGTLKSFSDEEKTIIAKKGAAFLRTFETELITHFLQLYSESHRDRTAVALNHNLKEKDFSTRFEKILMDYATEVLVRKHPTKKITGTIKKSTVVVPEFYYPASLRKIAANSFTAKKPSTPSWAVDSKKTAKSKLESIVADALNKDELKDFKEDMLSRSLRSWYSEQSSLIGLL